MLCRDIAAPEDYNNSMTIRLRPELEAEISRVARERGRDVDAIVADAVQQYLDAAAITDVTAADIA